MQTDKQPQHRTTTALSTLFMAVACAVTLNGCGGGGSDAAPPAPAPAPAPAVAAPTNVSISSAQTVTAAQPVTFSVSATSETPLAYQWQRNGSDIAGATGKNFTHLAQSSENGSQYRVRASNPGGDVLSNAVALVVLPARTGSATLFAGTLGGDGNLDGTGDQALFALPTAVVTDAAGNVFVADDANRVIRKITPKGVVTTFSGTGQTGGEDGPADSASFSKLSGIAIDGAGNLYVTNSIGSGGVRKITPDGTVSLLAGLGDLSGIAVDAAGNVVVASPTGNSIFRIAPDGFTIRLAGQANAAPGVSDGVGTAASFSRPGALAIDSSGNILVVDGGGRAVRKVTSAGVVSTLVPASLGFVNADGIAVDRAGNVLLAIRNVIRKISPSGAVSILAGAPDEPGVADGPAQVARFGGLTGLALDPQGNLVAADATRIRKIDLSTGIVTTLAGSVRPLSREFTGRQAVDALGNVFVVTSPTATQPSYGVRKITAAGVATMVATGLQDAREGIAVDLQGNVYVVERGTPACPDNPGFCTTGRIRKIPPQGEPSILAGSFDNRSHQDGVGAQASLIHPSGLAVDNAGNLYLGEDFAAGAIRRITPAGVVTTIGSNIQATGVAVDGAGNNIYASACVFYSVGHFTVIKAVQQVIRIGLDGSSRVLAGTSEASAAPGTPIFGNADGPGAAARFKCPSGIALDRVGNLLVADYGNHTVRQISPAGQVSTVLGRVGARGISLGPLPATLYLPYGVTFDAAGNLYVGSFSVILKVRFDD